MTAVAADPFAGWTFERDPETGARYVKTPNGVERIYSQDYAATFLVTLIRQSATDPAPALDYQLALWRRVVGEDEYRQALAVVGAVAEQYGGRLPEDADYFETRLPEERR